ncbi:MAG: histidine kinase [Saprospiraceae bacterium]|nr:histidine kinase [Saprospiraceae bacterium]
MKRHQTGIPKKYIYLVTVLFCAAVMVQVSTSGQTSSVGVFVRRFVLFGSIYVFWALSIDYINAIFIPLEKIKSTSLQIIERILSVLLLVLLNLVVTNCIYYAILIGFTSMNISEAYIDFEPYIIKSILIRLFDVLIIGLILRTITANQHLHQQNLKVISLENQLHLSQLETLRNQLDPHFLFNTLHTLNTLIGYDDKKARSMVIKVTKLLRKILDKRTKQLITFQEEIDYFKNYLDIEEERFHDRLTIILNIEEATNEIMVPTLMLQPLIENAFKHGISQVEEKGTIQLSAYIKDDQFVINLSNSIPTKPSSSSTVSTNIGLQNLDSRLQQVFGEGYTLQTQKNISTFEVTIRINHKH